ncbi:hypothetical protein [Christensenella hongkongensis]|uniref:hypothetical protein n=1 Tax=Christensenella hongkongensis TaxID=270498 RepID=UPI002672544A|nr:hypothetical protein [Christensenella hongkongensis]
MRQNRQDNKKRAVRRGVSYGLVFALVLSLAVFLAPVAARAESYSAGLPSSDIVVTYTPDSWAWSTSKTLNVRLTAMSYSIRILADGNQIDSFSVGNNNSHNTVLGEAYNGKYIAIQYYTAKHTWHDVYNINPKIDSSAPGFSGQGQNTGNWAQSKTISATVADDKSQVNRVFWSRSNGATSGTGMSRVSGNAASGLWRSGNLTDTGTYYIVSYDNTGNRSQTTVTINNIDRTGPAVSAAQETDEWYGPKKIVANVTDSQSGTSSVFWSKSNNATSGTAMTRTSGNAASGTYESQAFTADEMGTYYIRAKDAVGNYGTVQTVVVDKVDATPPAIASIKCKNTGKGYRVSITLEETGTGVDKATVGIGASREEEMMQQAEYDSLTGEYSFILPGDGKDYYIFASDVVGNAMIPVQVPRLWLPHTTDTGIFTNESVTGEAIKSGEADIPTYGYIGSMPKAGVDMDEDGTVDAIAPESDMINVTVPSNVMMYATWSDLKGEKRFYAPVSAVVNNNAESPVRVSIEAVTPESASAAFALADWGELKTEDNISLKIRPATAGQAVTFGERDVTQISKEAPLEFGVLEGGSGMFYTFEGDYARDMVQTHMGESLVCSNVFRFTKAQ